MLAPGAAMILRDLDRRLSEFLDLAAVTAIDRSRNGLQVARRGADVRRVAFAVDASLEAFRRVAAAGAEVLVVHHGLFWADPVVLTGSAYERVRFLVEHDLALWAAHLPLDLHPEVGNNASLARQLGLLDVEPFGLHRGIPVGCKGRLPSPLALARLAAALGDSADDPVTTLAFGPAEVRNVGIVSGDAPLDVEQAVREGLDAFVTGEPAHQVFHYCREEGINALFAGHYRTETHGPKALAAWLARETGLETAWIDVPTGL
jgi:dinuclear metal center YbgI/SA1388 family protein